MCCKIVVCMAVNRGKEIQFGASFLIERIINCNYSAQSCQSWSKVETASYARRPHRLLVLDIVAENIA